MFKEINAFHCSKRERKSSCDSFILKLAPSSLASPWGGSVSETGTVKLVVYSVPPDPEWKSWHIGVLMLEAAKL